jgi:hypothetical protein
VLAVARGASSAESALFRASDDFLVTVTAATPPQAALLCVVYPSIAGWPVGRGLGRLYESIPVRVGGIKLSYLLFCLPTAPLAASLYGLQKLLGEKYVLTTAAVERRRSIGNALLEAVPLDEAGTVEVERSDWEALFRTGTVRVRSAEGQVRMIFAGVSDPDAFAGTIRDALVARRTVAASMAHLARRQAGETLTATSAS